MTKEKRPVIYAFIDSQNLNLGSSKDIFRHQKRIYEGWKLDFKRFRIYLSDKYRVKKAILFIGYIPNNRILYQKLQKFGYELVFKPTVMDTNGKVKGNIDAEVVLYSCNIEYSNYDKAIIVSGDGDFYCLYRFLISKHKLQKILIPNRYSESTLLKEFQDYKDFINRDRAKLEFKP